MATSTLAAILSTPLSEPRPATVDRILVIEDDTALRKILQRLFSSKDTRSKLPQMAGPVGRSFGTDRSPQ